MFEVTFVLALILSAGIFGYVVRYGPIRDFGDCIREFQEHKEQCERDKAELLGEIAELKKYYQNIIDELLAKIISLEIRVEYLEARR